MLAARFIRRYSSSIRSSNEIRRAFVNFFNKEGHELVNSTKVVRPRFDQKNPFVTPELNQLRGFLSGKEKVNRRFQRVVNIQKNLQHNSILDVGKDLSTLSFYETMGNWAFNNAYGKERACNLAWRFLTNIMKIPKDRLSVTYFGGNSEVPEDVETLLIWKRIGVPESSIHPMIGESYYYALNDSFFGPCSISTKIHHKKLQDSCLWNIGFTNYERLRAGDDVKVLTADTMHVDTEMRLEDLTRVVQGCSSVFDTDLFVPIIRKIEQVSHKKYNGRIDVNPSDLDYSFRVVADHMRARCVAWVDGNPSTSHRAFSEMYKNAVRAAWYAVHRLGAPHGSLVKFVPPVVESLGTAYPELKMKQKKIEEAVVNLEKITWSKYDKDMAKRRYRSAPNGPELLIRRFESKTYEETLTLKQKAINFIRSTIRR